MGYVTIADVEYTKFKNYPVLIVFAGNTYYILIGTNNVDKNYEEYVHINVDRNAAHHLWNLFRDTYEAVRCEFLENLMNMEL